MKRASIRGGTQEARGPGSVACHLWGWFAALVLCTGCHTERATSVSKPAQAHGILTQLEPGVILLTAQADTAALSADPPNAKVAPASEGAGSAVRSVLNTPQLGNAYLEAAVSVVEVPLVPFAAAYGAVRTGRQRLTPAKLSEAEQNLLQAMKANAGSAMLRDKVAEAAHQKTSRLVVCAASAAAAPTNRLPVSAVLELAVEQLSLKAEQHEHRLYMAARARLLRSSDGAVLLERAYHYQSGPDLYVDWSRWDALHRVAQTGYESMAEAIARDVFQPAAEPPLLIGPGQKFSSPPHSRSLPRGVPWCARAAEEARTPVSKPPLHRLQAGRWRPKALVVLCRAEPSEPPGRPASGREDDSSRTRPQPAVEPTAATRPALQGANLTAPNAATIEVYTGRDDERLRSPKSGPGVETTTPMETDTGWAMDGLEQDRNAVVQFGACLAAVPMGLWEQTVGATLQWRRNKTEKLAEGLDRVPEQQHFAAGLVDEVARHLRSQVLNQVLRTEEQPRFALTVPTQVGKTETASAPASTNCQLALHLQVLDTKLVGKHLHSRSRALCVEVQAVVLRASDGQELYSRPIHYRSSSKRLKDWSASDAKLFREELEACSRQTAQAVAGELIAHGFAAQAK
jgi:hypothetical protein